MTNVSVQASNRWYGAQESPEDSFDDLKTEVFRERHVSEPFGLVGLHAAPLDQTVFLVRGNADKLLIAAGLFNTAEPLLAAGEQSADDLEIFFDCYHDHMGFFQFQFSTAYGVNRHRLLPYPDSYSTAFPIVDVKSHQWDRTFLKKNLDRVNWLFASFDARSIFRNGRRCGFNVGRYRSWLKEASSWNFCAGMGFPDPISFGHLYLGAAPAAVRGLQAEIRDRTLRLKGAVETAGRSLALELAAPDGERIPMTLRLSGSTWEAEANVNPSLYGRYRLYPKLDAEYTEPDFLFFDMPAVPRKRKFLMSMTYDIPDNFTGCHHYTPAMLDGEMRQFADWGINRIYWIDYGLESPFWNFWDAHRSFEECGGDFLPLALRQAKAAGMELYGIFKTFDMAFNRVEFQDPTQCGATDVDGKTFLSFPEIKEHQEWTMQTHPAWRREARFPIREVTLYSEQPIPALDPKAIRIWVSRDNQHYTPYAGAFTVQQGAGDRPRYLWTPAGKTPEAGRVHNAWLKLAGLANDAPFMALEIAVPGFAVTNPRFTLMEGLDASGQEPPISLSLNGSLKTGFLFNKEGGSWMTGGEEILRKFTWNGAPLGVMFRSPVRLPTMLEPSFEGARAIWLDRVKRVCECGADGVDIRTLCHHNGCLEWLRFAFAEPVREEFRRRYGREVKPEPDDYEKVRRLRGEFFTQFLREAKAVTRRYGKKLAIHFEPRMGVPASLEPVMQIFWDWETWLNEGIMDELTLKYWTSHSTYIHEKVLPVARRKGIPVLVECQLIDPRTDVRGVEKAERVIREAHAAGFDGVIWYEAWGFLMPNPAGGTTRRGIAEPMIRKADEIRNAL